MKMTLLFAAVLLCGCATPPTDTVRNDLVTQNVQQIADLRAELKMANEKIALLDERVNKLSRVIKVVKDEWPMLANRLNTIADNLSNSFGVPSHPRH